VRDFNSSRTPRKSIQLLEIVPGEKEANWRPGFYLVENSPIPFEISLRAVWDLLKGEDLAWNRSVRQSNLLRFAVASIQTGSTDTGRCERADNNSITRAKSLFNKTYPVNGASAYLCPNCM